jgi:hypothetical protein
MIFIFGAIRPEFKYGKIGLIILDIAILLGLLLAVSCLLLVGYISISTYCSDIWFLFPASVISFFITYALYKWLRIPVHQKFVEASQIVSMGDGRPATLCFPAITGWSGLLVELKDNHQLGIGNKIISLGLPKKIKIPKGNLEVIFRSDTTNKLSTVVAEISGQHFVGSIRRQHHMLQEVQRIRRLLISLLWLGIL